jgi:hypothetical protein
VVPLQLALVPLLKLHQQVGIGQSFVGIWLAHTGFGLPLAIYLLRNYMVGLPRDIIESAKVDGATDFQIFTRIILPLSFPALASFAIFQFLWTWNDLLVAKVFLPSNDESWVMTVRIADDLLGTPRRRLGYPRGCGLRVDRGAADRVLHDAALPRARLAGRFGQVGAEYPGEHDGSKRIMNLMQDVARDQIVAPDKDWWRGAVIYQIYPRSFQDSNHDGIGDLAGIIHRLHHVAELGVDAIWISPFFRSPMLDFGYDVSDYRDVDPMFGTLGDFDALIHRAHELGLKVLIDLVLSHTSNQHAWFQESVSSRDNPKADWYVWADAKPDGSAAQQLAVDLRRSAWEWSGDRMQYYLHNFLKEQPDLNLHNPEVQEELLAIARFWLDRGVDGFRLDTINFYFHDKELRDNPALDPALRNATIAPEVNPYNWQDHLYDKNQPENLEFLRRFRALLDEYPAATSVGEVGDAQYGMEIQAEYTSGGDKVHMCYSFDFLSGITPTPERVGEVVTRYEKARSATAGPAGRFPTMT